MATDFFVSILTPTLNCAATLRETLDSVETLAEKLPGQIQHLIGDGGSTDGTMDQLAEYVRRNPWAAVHVLPGKSIPLTLDALLPEARGRWITVLNGDDTLDVSNMASLLAADNLPKGPAIICGDMEMYAVDGKKIGVRTCNVDQLNRFMSVSHPGMLADKRVFDRIGCFGPDAPSAYDYIWTWRAYRIGIPFDYRPLTLARFRLGGVSQRRLRRAQWEIFCAKRKAGAGFMAWQPYLTFLIKYAIKQVLPTAARRRVVAAYRQAVFSIDRYVDP